MITIKGITTLIKNTIYIIKNYHKDIRDICSRINAAEKLIRERTDIHTSMDTRGGCYVIVVGSYKNSDYIQTFNMPSNDFSCLIEELMRQRRYGKTRTIDAPPNFCAAFKRDFMDN